MGVSRSSFAPLCDSGGMRRCWLRGLAKPNKRYSLAAAAHNLSLVLRKLFGMGQPRSLQGAIAAICAFLVTLLDRCQPPAALRTRFTLWSHAVQRTQHRVALCHWTLQIVPSSTDC